MVKTIAVNIKYRVTPTLFVACLLGLQWGYLWTMATTRYEYGISRAYVNDEFCSGSPSSVIFGMEVAPTRAFPPFPFSERTAPFELSRMAVDLQ